MVIENSFQSPADTSTDHVLFLFESSAPVRPDWDRDTPVSWKGEPEVWPTFWTICLQILFESEDYRSSRFKVCDDGHVTE
jgi:hypothetical protein